MSDSTLMPIATLVLGEVALCLGAGIAAVGGALVAVLAADGRGAARGALVSGLGVAGLLAFLGEDLAALLVLVASSVVAFALALVNEPRRSRVARAVTAIVSGAAALLAAALVLREDVLATFDVAGGVPNGPEAVDAALATAALAISTALGFVFATAREAPAARDGLAEGADERSEREPRP